MKYYKLVDNINSDSIVETKISNYGNGTLINWKNYYPLISFIIEHSKNNELPLDFYLTINNNISTLGEKYIEILNLNKYFEFTLDKLTNSQKHIKYLINTNIIIEVINGLNQFGFKYFGEGYYLWEVLAEIIRDNDFPDKPSRRECIYLFDNKKDCEYYKNTHTQGLGKMCEVELLETKSLFSSDMKIIDLIPNEVSFKEAKIELDKYWNQKHTSNPVIEHLFEGKCILKPI
jgi:hypothetical protein